MDSFVIDPLRRVAVRYDRYYDADQGHDRGDGGLDMGHVRVSHLIRDRTISRRRTRYKNRCVCLWLRAMRRSSIARRRAYIMRGRPNDAVVLSLLRDMRDPTEHARSREAGGEELLRDIERRVHHALVELEVGAQCA